MSRRFYFFFSDRGWFCFPNFFFRLLGCASALVAGEEKRSDLKLKFQWSSQRMQNWSSAFDPSLHLSHDFACRRRFSWLSDEAMRRTTTVQQRRMFLQGDWKSCSDASSSSARTKAPAGPGPITVSLLGSQRDAVLCYSVRHVMQYMLQLCSACSWHASLGAAIWSCFYSTGELYQQQWRHSPLRWNRKNNHKDLVLRWENCVVLLQLYKFGK